MSEVEIQCPYCGELLVFVKDHPKAMFCYICNKFYSEALLRERCGL